MDSYMKGTAMMSKHVLPAFAVLLGLSALCIQASESAAPKADVQKKSALVRDVYPGLASGSLSYAKLSDLPAGVVLKAEELTLSQKEVADEVAQAPEEMRAQLEKNGFFLLENLTTRRLLALQAKAKTPEQKEATASDERELVQKYLTGLVANVEVNEAEVAKFYEENKDACGGATLDQVKDQLKQLVLQQKQQDLVDEHVRTLGQRMPIEVSASWTKEQAVLAKDNPVDKARSSGKPSLVDFGSTGCRPCDMLAPILETLKQKYAGKVTVLFGKEAFRHVGFWPQAEIERKLAEMGVTQ